MKYLLLVALIALALALPSVPSYAEGVVLSKAQMAQHQSATAPPVVVNTASMPYLRAEKANVIFSSASPPGGVNVDVTFALGSSASLSAGAMRVQEFP